MTFYKDYRQALVDAKSEQEKRFEERKAQVDGEYDRSETRIRDNFQTQLNKLQEDKDKTLEEMDTLVNGKDSLAGKLRNLEKKRDRLKRQHTQLKESAADKSEKCKEARENRFKFWWKTV